MKHVLLGIICLFVGHLHAQVISGKVIDKRDNLPVIGANVIIKGTTIGTSTGVDGDYELTLRGVGFPATVEVSYLGMKTMTFTATKAGKQDLVYMDGDAATLGMVTVVEQRLSQKQRESALSVVALDVKAISETPSVSFYESLGNLQGVDLTSASIGFKIINTRGFNSTSPVRSLQIIDGVDNQAPGLNFSLGNFVGASELDIVNVDIIAGASSAFYGPSAFNGVVAMTTKDPFLFRGTSASVKVGERSLREFAVRHAHVVKNRKGEERFAWKLNAYYLEADDWVADNYGPTDESLDGPSNPGGFDAVNIYGDEVGFPSPSRNLYPGLERFYRNGIREVDLVDYDTRNLKLAAAFHYRFDNKTELIYASNFGYGTTVYQGDNRYSLKDLMFFQNRLEWRKKDKFFIRAYATNEDAGNTYDAYFTALKMQDAVFTDRAWQAAYESNWPISRSDAQNMPGWPTANRNTERDLWNQQYEDFLLLNADALRNAHQSARNAANAGGLGELIPGTPLFDSLFNHYTTTTFADGGTRFFDRSALYHIHGEYKWSFPKQRIDLTAGGNSRLYAPNSNGSIFSDTAGIRISNFEYGVYAGATKKLMGELLSLNATVRMDKNENFGYYFSPAFSLVYNLNNVTSLRVSTSSAIRNPTLQDQYLYYNVGRAILLGNLNGKDSLVPVENVTDYLGKSQTDRQNHVWEYYNVAAVRPERVQTVEGGFRTTLFKNLFIDANYYYSWYRDFIGFNIGAEIDFDLTQGLPLQSVQVYRVAANAIDRVTTQGFSFGYNYYFWDKYTFNGNYSWNRLNSDSDDPIIPAFNTPEHKFNVGLSASELEFNIGNMSLPKLGFAVNYRWIEGFIFEGSPQFTGAIDTYDMVDAQISILLPKWNSVLKFGGNNILNNLAFQVYGGPRVGRLMYVSWLWDLKK